MSDDLKFSYPLNAKVKNIEALLRNQVGLIVSGKDCIVVATKSDFTLQAYEQPNGDSHLFIWAVSGSASEIERFEEGFRSLASAVETRFSKRDMNVYIVKDFVSAYLSARFYNRKSDKPVALEFILGEITKQRVVFFVVSYDGNLRKLEGSDRVSVIGCANDAQRQELTKLMAKNNLSKMSSVAILKIIEPLLGKFAGKFVGMGFDITLKKTRKQKPRTISLKKASGKNSKKK